MITQHFPEPYGSMGRSAVLFRTREFVFLRDDELAYESLLRQAFPGLHFLGRLSRSQEIATDPPVAPQFSSLAGRNDLHPVMHFSGKSLEPSLTRNKNGWSAAVDAWPYANWLREPDPGKRSVSTAGHAPVETLLPSRIGFVCRRWVAEDIRAAMKALRFVGRVGTRNAFGVHWPSLEPRSTHTRPHPLVFGHNAMAWLRAAPDRIACLRVSADGVYATRPGPPEND